MFKETQYTVVPERLYSVLLYYLAFSIKTICRKSTCTNADTHTHTCMCACVLHLTFGAGKTKLERKNIGAINRFLKSDFFPP